MKQTDVERRLKESFERATPDVWEGILSGCAQQQKGKVIPMTTTIKTKKNRRFVPALAGIAAALVLVAGGFFGFGQYQKAYAVDSVIALDVNPSVELEVSQTERVLSAQALNEDAQVILSGLDLEGSNLNVAVHAIIGSMVTNGYIDELANSILISVENDDAQRGAELQQRLTQEVETILSDAAVDGAVLSQTVTATQEVQDLANDYGISQGKAQLILNLVAANPQYTVADLVGRTINELNLLASAGGSLGDVSATGSASDLSYIGQDAALEKACAHAGVSVSSVTLHKCEFDWEDGAMVYELEFYVGNVEYEYDINATTGAVVKSSRDDHGASSSGGATGTDIGGDAALQKAYDHAGVSASAATVREMKRDYDDGRAVYDIEFHAAGVKYEYEIDAYTGAVVKYESETISSGNAGGNTGSNGGGSTNGNGGSGTNYIGSSAALQKAYDHAGVSASNVFDVESDFDWDDGRAVYEIEFQCGATEYEYEIDAVTGAVITYEMDTDDDYVANTGSTGSTGGASRMTADQAKSAACTHAGVSSASVTWTKCELDEDDGRYCYELEFCYNGTEYEYEIGAASGAVYSSEQDHCDDGHRHGHS